MRQSLDGDFGITDSDTDLAVIGRDTNLLTVIFFCLDCSVLYHTQLQLLLHNSL